MGQVVEAGEGVDRGRLTPAPRAAPPAGSPRRRPALRTRPRRSRGRELGQLLGAEVARLVAQGVEHHLLDGAEVPRDAGRAWRFAAAPGRPRAPPRPRAAASGSLGAGRGHSTSPISSGQLRGDPVGGQARRSRRARSARSGARAMPWRARHGRRRGGRAGPSRAAGGSHRVRSFPRAGREAEAEATTAPGWNRARRQPAWPRLGTSRRGRAHPDRRGRRRVLASVRPARSRGRAPRRRSRAGCSRRTWRARWLVPPFDGSAMDGFACPRRRGDSSRWWASRAPGTRRTGPSGPARRCAYPRAPRCPRAPAAVVPVERVHGVRWQRWGRPPRPTAPTCGGAGEDVQPGDVVLPRRRRAVAAGAGGARQRGPHGRAAAPAARWWPSSPPATS